MSISVRSEWRPNVAVRVYTAHVRCSLCDAEVTASVGGDRGAQDAADIACSRAADAGWKLTPAPECPAHRGPDSR